MRTRQRLGQDERRAQILRATVETLAEHGYQGTSLTRIADRAEISKGLISHYFADKDELMAQTAITTVAALRDAIADQLDLTARVPEVIRAALRHAAALGDTHRSELAALNQIIPHLHAPDGNRRLSLTDYEETYQAQEQLFARGQVEGSLRKIDTRVMAVTYQGAIDTMLHYAETHPGTDLTRWADALAELLLSGIEL